MRPDTVQQLELLIRARYALVVVETVDAHVAEEMLRGIAAASSLHYFHWTRSRGLRRGAGPSATWIDDTKEPEKALAFAEREGSGIYMFRELGPYLSEPAVVSHVLDLCATFASKRGALVLTGHDVPVPEALRPHATKLAMVAPTFDDYRALVERVFRYHATTMNARDELTPQERARFINNLTGLTLTEAEKIVTRLIIDDGVLRASDIAAVADAKRQAIEQHGLLEYFPADQKMADVAGLAGLKAWLGKRRLMVADPQRAAAFGLDFPRGVLLLGVPGCGKSLCAKAVAGEWALPLLKLDPGNLYDKYVGESEKNFRRALQTAERMAPVVLWIDELEKAFAGTSGGEDTGVSSRVFGSFLGWLQERRGDVFVVATSNDVSKLPPEFIRKGRFDEIFFVDLPDDGARHAIFEIHLRRRGQDVAAFDLARLRAASEGFSGAEIEQAIVSGLYTAFAAGGTLTTDVVLGELAATRPLSRTMGEHLQALRDWAVDRTVPA